MVTSSQNLGKLRQNRINWIIISIQKLHHSASDSENCCKKGIDSELNLIYNT